MTPFRSKTASVSTSATVYLAVALNEELANELEGATIREKDKFQPKKHDIDPDISASLGSLDRGPSTSSHSLLEGPLIRTRLQSAGCWSAEFSMKHISGTDLVLKPDIVLLNPDPGDIQFSWRNVVSVLELTSEDFSSRLCLQITRKAYRVFAQPGRRFVIILSIANQLPRLHLFDRVGVVHSCGYDIHLHPNLVVRILNTLTLGRLEHLGHDPTLCFSPAISRMKIKYRRSRLTIQAAKKTNDITPVLFNSEIIRGRATVSFLVEDTDRNVGKRYVVKDSWTCTGRATTEEEMLERMKERKLTNGVTTLEAARTVRIGEEDDSTNLRRPSCLFSDDHSLPEIRVHRRLLLAPVGSPLTEFLYIQELLSVLIDIIEIHKTLLDCGILHRDINISNILMFAGGPWPIREKDTEKLKRLSEREDIIRERGFRRGLLINSDYAKVIDGSSTGTSQGERTGMTPFMAFDILCGHGTAIVHEPRHDLESIIYVLIWICVLYRHPKDPQRQFRFVDNTCLERWVLPEGNTCSYMWVPPEWDIHNLGLVKASEPSTQTSVKQFTSYFEGLKKPARLLYEVIGRSRMRGGPPITHDSVKAILLDAFFNVQEPSSFWNRQGDPTKRISCGRPRSDEDTIPPTLLHPVFGEFVDNCKTIEITPDDYTFAIDLTNTMSGLYDNEAARFQAVEEIFQRYGINFTDSKVNGKFVVDANMSTNGHHYVIAKFKNEVSTTPDEPYFDSILYYLNSTRDVSRECSWSSLPCLLLAIAGPNIWFAGATWNLRPSVQALSSPLALYFHSSDTENQLTVARYLAAFRKATQTLEEYYDDQQLNQLEADYRAIKPAPPQLFPYPTKYKFHDKEIKFHYKRQQNEKSLVFFGTERSDPICIKFVRTYSREAHDYFASLGCAPALRGFEKLPGGWMMVVMDKLSDDFETLRYRTSSLPGSVFDDMLAKLKEFHAAGYVHGDLRDVNIMVSKSNKKQFMIIHFDWAEKKGEARYPGHVDHKGTKRPARAQFGEEILAEHDLFMIEKGRNN